MAFNATSGDMDWPTRLIWSKELEVQLLLSDIPLIAVGVLGIGAITLLMLVKRLYVRLPNFCINNCLWLMYRLDTATDLGTH